MKNVILLVWLQFLCFHLVYTRICHNGRCDEIGMIPASSSEDGRAPDIVEDCVDLSLDCKTLKKMDKCEDSPGTMIVNCPKTCNVCHLRSADIRCHRKLLNISDTPLVSQHGDIDSRIQSIINAPGKPFGHITIHSNSPWILSFNNFLKEKEIEAIVGAVAKWEKSTDTGTTNEHGVTGRILSENRNSYNAWCRQRCESNKYIRDVLKRIQEMLQISINHMEPFQILRYEPGQYYNTHHDSSIKYDALPCGQRIFTLFLYLSDVDSGGETSFPLVNVTIRPKKGSALLWPGVLNNDPFSIDWRTRHEAVPVKTGVKYAANSWIHNYDFRTAYNWACAG